MGKHVDTSSLIDDFGDLPRRWDAAHRKPGEPMIDPDVYLFSPAKIGLYTDPWSGNPDTDRAWRPDYCIEPWS